MKENLEQKSKNNSSDENKEQIKRNQGFLISLLTGAIAGLIIDEPGKIQLTASNIFIFSGFSGIAMPFLLNYEQNRGYDESKEKESFKTTFMRNPYYFTGMLTGLTLAKIINHYVLS